MSSWCCSTCRRSCSKGWESKYCHDIDARRTTTMNDAINNPYSPPRAEVFDFAQLDQRIDRPRHVFHAVALLWITLILQATGLFFMWRLFRLADAMFLALIAFSTVTWGITAWIVAMIERGRNWARITYLVLFLLGAPFVVVSIVVSFRYTPIAALSAVLQLALQLTAMIMVFIPPAGAWFRG